MNNDLLDRLEQLVDGELDRELRRQWITSIADDSSEWKQIVIAFVEKQILDEAMRDMVSPCESHGTELDTTATQLLTESESTAFDNPASPKLSSEVRFKKTRLLAIAASLLACLFGGWLLGVSGVGGNGGTRGVSYKGSSTDNMVSQRETFNKSTAETEASNSPDVDEKIAEQLSEALSRSITPVTDEFRRSLLRAGFAVSDHREFTNVELLPGKFLKMPVRHVNVEYVGMEAYQ